MLFLPWKQTMWRDNEEKKGFTLAVFAIVPSLFNAGFRPPVDLVTSWSASLALTAACRRLVSARVSPSACVPRMVFASLKINSLRLITNRSSQLIQHTFAVVFIVVALDSFGLDFVFVAVLEDAAVDGGDAVSSSVFVSEVSRAFNIALTCFSLSSPHDCFKNAWPACRAMFESYRLLEDNSPYRSGSSHSVRFFQRRFCGFTLLGSHWFTLVMFMCARV